MVTQARKAGSESFHSDVNSVTYHVCKTSVKKLPSHGVGKCLQTTRKLSSECKMLSVFLKIIIKINLGN